MRIVNKGKEQSTQQEEIKMSETEEKRDTLFNNITGSGKLDIYQKGGDSLFGRYQLYHLYPFTVGGVLFKITPDNFMNDIQNTDLRKENEDTLQAIENFTGFPGPLFSESKTRLHRWSHSHEQLIIQQELRDITRIREL